MERKDGVKSAVEIKKSACFGRTEVRLRGLGAGENLSQPAKAGFAIPDLGFQPNVSPNPRSGFPKAPRLVCGGER